MTKSRRDHFKSTITSARRDLEGLHALRDEAEARGLDPDEIDAMIDQLADWCAVLEFVERHWADPRDRPDWRNSATARALERLRAQQRSKFP